MKNINPLLEKMTKFCSIIITLCLIVTGPKISLANKAQQRPIRVTPEDDPCHSSVPCRPLPEDPCMLQNGCTCDAATSSCRTKRCDDVGPCTDDDGICTAVPNCECADDFEICIDQIPCRDQDPCTEENDNCPDYCKCVEDTCQERFAPSPDVWDSPSSDV